MAGVFAFLGLLVILGVMYFVWKPETETGTKAVELMVVDSEGKETVYKLTTDGEYLEDVMKDAQEKGFTYSGEEGDYGLMIDTVNGEMASFEENDAYWGVFVNGEYANYGISEQPVTDGDQFEIRYTVEK